MLLLHQCTGNTCSRLMENVLIVEVLFVLSFPLQRQFLLSRSEQKFRLLTSLHSTSHLPFCLLLLLLPTARTQQWEQARRTSVCQEEEEQTEEEKEESHTKRLPGRRGAGRTRGGQSGTRRGRNTHVALELKQFIDKQKNHLWLFW